VRPVVSVSRTILRIPPQEFHMPGPGNAPGVPGARAPCGRVRPPGPDTRLTSGFPKPGAPTTDLRAQLQVTLGDTYVLDRELGGGGMSRVFLAHETALGRPVVVKVLMPTLAAGVSVDRFRREILLVAKLQHPHIVPVYSAGEAAGLPYFTMPFVEGESLRERIAHHGELPISEVIRLLRNVASALSYAHGQGVIH